MDPGDRQVPSRPRRHSDEAWMLGQHMRTLRKDHGSTLEFVPWADGHLSKVENGKDTPSWAMVAFYQDTFADGAAVLQDEYDALERIKDLRKVERSQKSRRTVPESDSLQRSSTPVFSKLDKRNTSMHPHDLIPYYGTKFETPNRNEFWNNLLVAAERRFFLIGQTNKSWINKDEEQSRALGDAIVRIVRSGGMVRVSSIDTDPVVEMSRKFFDAYVWRQLDEGEKAELSGGTSTDLRLRYSVIAQSNYDAVVSDDRLILLPNMNSDEFRDEAMVLEINRQNHPSLFKNYLGDIERTCASGRVEFPR